MYVRVECIVNIISFIKELRGVCVGALLNTNFSIKLQTLPVADLVNIQALVMQ